MGLSFAVPINVVENVYAQLREHGHVSRGRLGVLIQDVTRELAESFGMDKPHGALIAKVLPDSPAEKAGLEIGDVVVKFNSDEVSFSSNLPPMVGNTPIGETVPLEIIRRGKKRTLKLTIAKLPEEEKLALRSAGKSGETSSNRLKVIIKDLSESQQKALELEDNGIIMEKVLQGPASMATLRKGS